MRPIAIVAIISLASCHLLGCGSLYAQSVKPVYVQLMVDEEEAMPERLWKPRLVKRLRDASAILMPHTRIEFVPVAFGKWDSDDRYAELGRSLAEFEHEVRPAKAQLAIGFSSQYQFVRGRNNLGGTRGPLRRHILMRERAPKVEEIEKVEVLVHELGHFFGATHSALPDSVMRPMLGDGKARVKTFRIGFDPDNAKIIRLIGREYRERNVRSFAQLSPYTLGELKKHYTVLSDDSPKDASAKRFLNRVETALDASGSASFGVRALP